MSAYAAPYYPSNSSLHPVQFNSLAFGGSVVLTDGTPTRLLYYRPTAADDADVDAEVHAVLDECRLYGAVHVTTLFSPRAVLIQMSHISEAIALFRSMSSVVQFAVDPPQIIDMVTAQTRVRKSTAVNAGDFTSKPATHILKAPSRASAVPPPSFDAANTAAVVDRNVLPKKFSNASNENRKSAGADDTFVDELEINPHDFDLSFLDKEDRSLMDNQHGRGEGGRGAVVSDNDELDFDANELAVDVGADNAVTSSIISRSTSASSMEPNILANEHAATDTASAVPSTSTSSVWSSGNDTLWPQPLTGLTSLFSPRQSPPSMSQSISQQNNNNTDAAHVAASSVFIIVFLNDVNVIISGLCETDIIQYSTTIRQQCILRTHNFN